jgi:carbon storage regulator CsrA
VIVLARKRGDELIIGPNVVVRVEHISASRVRLSFKAPEGVSVRRLEPETEEERKAE